MNRSSSQRNRASETFEVPDAVMLDALKPGDAVKVLVCAERFWIILTTVDGDALHSTPHQRTRGKCHEQTQPVPKYHRDATGW